MHKFVPVHQAMKIPDAEGEVCKEWEKLDKLTAWNSPFCYGDGSLSSEKFGAGTKFSEIQRLGCTPR